MRLLLPFLLLVAAALAAPEDEKKKEPTAGEVVIPDPGTPIEDRAVAKQQVERFTAAFKAAADDKERVSLLVKLGGWDHPEVLKAASKLLRAKSESVAVAAIVVCARQSKSKDAAGRLLARVFGSDRSAEALAEICGPVTEAVPVYLQLLRLGSAADESDAWHAARALRELGASNEEVEAVMATLANHRSFRVREEARTALDALRSGAGGGR